MTETDLIDRFTKQMKIELSHNSQKGPFTEFTNFEQIITQFEYHKAKFFVAVRMGEIGAAREYLADCGNLLAALGNSLHMFDEEPADDGFAYEINKEVPIINRIKVEDQSTGNKIVN